MAHGVRLVFVNPDELLENIIEILQNTDYMEAQTTIKSERLSRNGIVYIMHDPERWEDTLKELELILAKQEVPLCIIN